MKGVKKLLAIILLTALIISSESNCLAQDSPPPPPAGGHGQTQNLPPLGGNAIIGEGLLFLLGLSIVYGSARLYHEKRKSRLNGVS